jgi:hypothetical protein
MNLKLRLIIISSGIKECVKFSKFMKRRKKGRLLSLNFLRKCSLKALSCRMGVLHPEKKHFLEILASKAVNMIFMIVIPIMLM